MTTRVLKYLKDGDGLKSPRTISGEGQRVPVTSSSIANPAGEDDPVLIRAAHDRYRCPERFLDFRLQSELPRDPKYLGLGAGTICSGRSAKSDHKERASIDLKALPIDPDEVIDNLLLERYSKRRSGTWENLLKRIYYFVRPLTSRWMRKQIQRFHASNWENAEFPKWPVDTTVETICENLLSLSLEAKRVDRIPFIWFWPNGARSCVAMTHDVEEEAGRNFCEQLMDIDDSYRIKASFQIVPEGRYAVSREFLSRLRDRGFEVCVQDLNHDGRLFDRRDEFLRRVELINRYGRDYGAKGYRSAVLYRKPEWYEDLDFSFDMSFPNVAPFDPQRGGCCTVMPYFIGNVLEIPLTTIQDYTLFHILDDYSTDLWKKQIEMILAKNGLISFIVHPDYIIDSKAQSVYRDLLAYFEELRGQEALWFALPGEIDRWWRARSRMSIAERDGSWEIVGEGAERAVLAFAREVDGKLVYELADPPTGKSQGAALFSADKPINAGL